MRPTSIHSSLVKIIQRFAPPTSIHSSQVQSILCECQRDDFDVSIMMHTLKSDDCVERDEIPHRNSRDPRINTPGRSQKELIRWSVLFFPVLYGTRTDFKITLEQLASWFGTEEFNLFRMLQRNFKLGIDYQITYTKRGLQGAGAPKRNSGSLSTKSIRDGWDMSTVLHRNIKGIH